MARRPRAGAPHGASLGVMAASASAPLPSEWQARMVHGSTAYVHVATRAIAWSRPYEIGGAAAETHALHPCDERMLELLAAEEQSAARPRVRDATEEAALDEAIVDPESAPRVHYADFAFHDPVRQHLENGGSEAHGKRVSENAEDVRQRASLRLPVQLGRVAVGCLRQYAASCLQAHAVTEVGPATGPQWEGRRYVPRHAVVMIDGVVVGEGTASSEVTARGLAAEAGLQALCPRLWRTYIESELRMSEVQLAVQKGLLLGRTVVDRTELETLTIDDDRLIDIDLSVAKTPLMLLQDYMAVTLGPNIVAHEAREVVARHPALGDEYPPSPGIEATVTVGTKRGVAFDFSRRRARQRASLEILKAAHPHLSLYKELLELYSPDSLSALQPEQFPVSLLPAQSAVAAELRAGDKFTSYSTQHLEKAEAKRQRTATVLASEADGGGGVGGAVDDGIPQTAPRVGAQNAEERRHLPGEGHNFVTQWQRQWAVERARAEAGRTENDTLFAFQIDQVAPRFARRDSRAKIARPPHAAGARDGGPGEAQRVARGGRRARIVLAHGNATERPRGLCACASDSPTRGRRL